MPREPTQMPPPKGRPGPGAYSPDDDEAQENDVTRASDMDAPGQLDVGANEAGADEETDPEEDAGDIEQPEDEDESDHIAERP